MVSPTDLKNMIFVKFKNISSSKVVERLEPQLFLPNKEIIIELLVIKTDLKYPEALEPLQNPN